MEGCSRKLGDTAAAASGIDGSDEGAQEECGRDGGYWTVQQVMDYLPLSPSTVRRRVKDKTIPSVQLGGKGCRILVPVNFLKQAGTAKPVKTSQEDTKTFSAGQQAAELPGPQPKWKKHLPKEIMIDAQEANK